MDGEARRHGERGQALVLYALLVGIVIGAGALVIDGGYGFVQARQAQNAADLASLGATGVLLPVCAGQTGVTNAQVTAVLDDVVTANAPAASGRWSGTYLAASGAPLSGAPALPDASGDAPSGACGVHVTVTARWPAFLAQIFGVQHLAARAAGGALVGANASAPPTAHGAGIVALAPTGNHTIWGGNAGDFQVNGNIMDDSTGGCSSAGCYADTVDNFNGSSTHISGQLDSVAPVALDPCFSPAGPTSATCPPHSGSVVTYGGGMDGSLPYEADPLRYLGTPTSADAACPGQAVQTFSSPGGTSYTPGVYTYPVYVTTSATFADCGSGVPGVYIFEAGLYVCPGAGETVSGSDIMLYDDSGGTPSGRSTPCGQQNTKGVPYPATDGIYLGGQGTVTLSGPNSGVWSHVLLYQDRSYGADIGLDDHGSDSGTIQLTGAIYDAPTSASSPSGPGGPGGPGPGPGPGPAPAGGTMDSGGGTGGGTITVDGVVVVDQFATSGTANVTITFDPSQVPGVGAVLVQ